MPNHTHKFTPSPPTPIPFTLCNHTTPPTPLPATTPTPSTLTKPAHFPFRCLPCDTAYRTSSQSLILDSYNGRIHEQASRLLIAAARNGTERAGRYDAEMVEEGERRIRDWRVERATEVAGIWKGFLARWQGGRAFEGGKEGVVKVRLAVDGEGGYVVEGVLGGGCVRV